MTIPGTATGIDHVGVVAPDLGRAAAEWMAAGFTVQPLAAHQDNGVPTGTGNRNIMLRHGYIELLATIDPARPSATLARFLARHLGAHILTLATDDAEAALPRLHRAGFAASLSQSSRAADAQDPQGPQARFARIPLTDQDPRLQLLQQKTPHLVWQERFLTHRNHAIALTEVIVAASPPEEFAARLSRAAGRPLAPDPSGGLALMVPGGTVRVMDAGAIAHTLAWQPASAAPCIMGVAIRTDDGNRAVGDMLPHATRLGDRVLAHLGGVAVLFTP